MRRLTVVQESFVTSSETAAVVLHALRWHGRVAEPRMAFDLRRSSVLSIVPCSLESVMEALPGDLRKSRWWRRFHIDWVGMRTSRQIDGQQQHRQGKPFLHVISSLVVFVIIRKHEAPKI